MQFLSLPLAEEINPRLKIILSVHIPRALGGFGGASGWFSSSLPPGWGGWGKGVWTITAHRAGIHLYRGSGQ